MQKIYLSRPAIGILSFFVMALFNAACVPGVSENYDNEVGSYSSAASSRQKDTFSVTVTGRGIARPGEDILRGKLLADRAAVVDAYRNLSERVAGLIVESYSRQGEFIIDRDSIHSETNSFLRGARVLEVKHENGISTAYVKIVLPSKRFHWYLNEMEEFGELENVNDYQSGLARKLESSEGAGFRSSSSVSEYR
ncbi:MAG: hypothetical protein AB7T15_09210 [Desulfuromonas sp.]|jgi:hypothetical protein|nr:hypothetical protein [Desulfuromonas thiophila]MDY0398836.1 hypothetical protein [Desulfuromonas thiophila]